MTASWYRWDGPDLILQLQVRPRSGREELADATEQGLKVRLTTPPVQGRANQALQALLAREFAVPKASIILERGVSGRRKQVRIRSPGRLPAALSIAKTTA